MQRLSVSDSLALREPRDLHWSNEIPFVAILVQLVRETRSSVETLMSGRPEISSVPSCYGAHDKWHMLIGSPFMSHHRPCESKRKESSCGGDVFLN